MKTSLWVSMLALTSACGAVHDVGQNPDDAGAGCTPQTTAADCTSGEVCDLGHCRTACGANYPGATCPSGTACDSYICRQTCTPAATCPSGSICDQNFCRPPTCPSSPCTANQGCAAGTCVTPGAQCNPTVGCGNNYLQCLQNVCVLRCGPNYSVTCPTGQTCNTAGYCT